MNKNIKKAFTISILTSMLVSHSVKAEDLGNSVLGYRKPTTNNYLYSCSNTVSEDDFWNSLLGGNTEVLTNPPKVNNTNNISNADNTVISYFQDAKDNLYSYLRNQDFTNLKSKAKSLIITGIDFLFYDGSIKGYTRKQITEKGKETIMQSIAEAIAIIDEYYPGLSDIIFDKYGQAKSYLKEKFNNILGYVKDWMGEDYYDAFGDEFKDLFEDFGDIGGLIGSLFDDKYQEWKLR